MLELVSLKISIITSKDKPIYSFLETSSSELPPWLQENSILASKFSASLEIDANSVKFVAPKMDAIQLNQCYIF